MTSVVRCFGGAAVADAMVSVSYCMKEDAGR